MKFSKLIIASGAAALVLASATPAFAAIPRLRAIPHTVYQGGSFALKAEYPNNDWAIIYSRLLPHPITLSAGHGPHYALVNVGASVTPGTYRLTLRCHRVIYNDRMTQMAEMNRHHMCEAHTWETVLRHTSPTPPPKPGHHYLRMHGKTPEVIINTGYGSMAGYVGQHHPARF